MHRESTLHTNTERNLTNRKGLTDATVLTADNNTLENLNTGLVTLNDLHVNVHSVAGAEFRNIVAQLCGIDLIQNVHRNNP